MRYLKLKMQTKRLEARRLDRRFKFMDKLGYNLTRLTIIGSLLIIYFEWKG